jgi:nucleotide-binding universal stress UspA family protein
LAEAMKLAKLTGAQLRLMHVIDEMPFLMNAEGYGPMSGGLLAMLKEKGESILQQARMLVKDNDLVVDTALFENLTGRLSDRVAEQAKQWNADLIVLGTHGRRGMDRLLLGSGAEEILRTAPVPVLLVRAVENAATAAQSGPAAGVA